MPGTAYRIYTLPASILQSASKNLLPVNKAGQIFLQTMLMRKSDGGRCTLDLNSPTLLAHSAPDIPTVPARAIPPHLCHQLNPSARQATTPAAPAP